jgi:hypothetical protein
MTYIVAFTKHTLQLDHMQRGSNFIVGLRKRNVIFDISAILDWKTHGGIIKLHTYKYNGTAQTWLAVSKHKISSKMRKKTS